MIHHVIYMTVSWFRPLLHLSPRSRWIPSRRRLDPPFPRFADESRLTRRRLGRHFQFHPNGVITVFMSNGVTSAAFGALNLPLIQLVA